MKLKQFSFISIGTALTGCYAELTHSAADDHASAKDISFLINELISKIYTETASGFNITIEPYFSGNFNYYHPDSEYNELAEEFSFIGNVGTTDLEITYDRQLCELWTQKSGSVSGIPGYQYIFPEYMWNFDFKSINSLNLPCNNGIEIRYTSEGSINDEDYEASVRVGVDEFGMSKKKYKTTLGFEAMSSFSTSFPIDYVHSLPQQVSTVIELQAKTSCINVFSSSCSADIDITNIYNDEKQAPVEISWKSRSGLLQIRYDNKSVFKLKFKYGKYWKMSYMCKDTLCGEIFDGYYVSNKMSHLITVPSTLAIEDISAEVSKLAGIHLRLYTDLRDSMGLNYNRVAQFLVYFDKFAQVLVSEHDSFDCSDVVRTVGLEWPWLADKYGVKSVQSHGIYLCSDVINPKVEEYLAKTVGPKVLVGRRFARSVLAAKSESDFDEWIQDMLVF